MSAFEILALLVGCWVASALGDVARAICAHAKVNADIANAARRDRG